MISLVFSINREVFRITIDKKRIWYLDRKWKKQIRLVPKDEDFSFYGRNPLSKVSIGYFVLGEVEEALFG